MYECPKGCVKSESKMIFRNGTYICPVCKLKGKWYPKWVWVDRTRTKNKYGHPYVDWENGKRTVNTGA